MRLAFFLLIAQVFTFSHILAEETQPLTIQDAIRLALSKNPTIRMAQNELEAARARIDIAKSTKHPNVSAAAQYLHTNALGTFTIPSLSPSIPPQTISIGAADNTIGILRLRQAIYTGGRIPAQIDRADALFDVALGRLETVKAEVVLQVREAYHNVLLAESLVRSAEQNLVAAKQHFETATAKFEAGTAPKFDVLRAKTQVSEAEQNLTEMRNQAQLARITLNRILGVSLSQSFNLSVPSSVTIPNKDLN
ncbi:MAG: TolC family protein, partial [Armatimonadota bacterium]|nr:TolC family protein [Armatimonadota bacterium]